MATKSYKICAYLVFALVMLSSRGATAQSGCSNNMINGLSSCVSYLRGNSSQPLPSCCTSLANVRQSQPECLCPMLSNIGATFSLGLALNRTLMMALPATCKLRTPQCDDVANGAAASPLSPPSDASSPASTDPAVMVPPSDFPSGSKTVPNINTFDVATTSIYLRTLTLLMAAWIVATFHFQL